MRVLFVGDDWAEAHHDIEIQDEAGRRLIRRRLPEGIGGIGELHELIGRFAGDDDDPGQVVVGIETDRGPWVAALLAAGYLVYAINPLSVSRYRDRHVTSGAKSDPGDAKVLADLVRTDRAAHRPIAGDSALAEAVKVLARGHQNLVLAARPDREHAALHAARVLPRRPRGIRGADQRRCAGRARDRVNARCGSAAVGLEDRCRVASRWPPAQRRDPRRGRSRRACQVSCVNGAPLLLDLGRESAGEHDFELVERGGPAVDCCAAGQDALRQVLPPRALSRVSISHTAK